MYKVPDKYYFRIHHVRPRFKDNFESVLVFMASQICKIRKENNKDFKNDLNAAIRKFPGNSNKSEKTINNWRTEISTLFGFFIDDGNEAYPGLVAEKLANDNDIPQFLNYFLYKFQYPGAHIKPKNIQEQINNHVKFHPARYILNVLNIAKKKNPDQPYLSVSECTHCIFNDLRCTRIDHESYLNTWNRIMANRRQKVSYDTKGDVTRYAKDILDYMDRANLLNSVNNTYYLNSLASDAIKKIRDSNDFFNEYDPMIIAGIASLEDIKSCKLDWFKYVNDVKNLNFTTDIYAYITQSENKYQKEKEKIEAAIYQGLQYKNTKEIGDQGEAIVYKYEVDNVNKHNKGELTHLITFIPTKLAVGFDFNSIEPESELRRYVEVKTTISSSPLIINSFHMTPNEVRTAKTVGKHYFVYRLQVYKDKRPVLTIFNDPIKLIEDKRVEGDLSNTADGLDVKYSPDDFKGIEI